ncbi:MAG TPA: tripartite tricarboxylate transporter substrate binding protein, partial [Pseudomonadales bacterium]|nr:tripartite tricarboxylate transporter substrate binding protein [Pseudomonadales bacterium]
MRRAPGAFLLLSLLAFAGNVSAEPHFHQLTILVPAGRGGGWDLTAKAIAEVLQQNGSVDSVSIDYSPGAGGLIGLAQFISSNKGQPNALLVGGKFM